MEELRAESQQLTESTGSIGRSKGASIASSHQQISVTVVTEFVRWNEEAISRCTLFSSQVNTPSESLIVFSFFESFNADNLYLEYTSLFLSLYILFFSLFYICNFCCLVNCKV